MKKSLHPPKSASRTLEDYLTLPWSFWIEKQEDTSPENDTGVYYFARVNELPGCMSDGATAEEAMRNIQEALKALLQAMLEDGIAIPEPIQVKDFKGQLVYRTTPDKHYRLAKAARYRGISINRLIDEAVDSQLAS